jgi:hypothetical protein
MRQGSVRKVSNLTKLMYCLCQTTTTGPFCVNGDVILTLEKIANALQHAAKQLLATYNMTPHSAFVVSDATAASHIPHIDDSRLTERFQATHPDDEPHQALDLTTTAAEMVESHWRHGQKTNRLMGLNFFGMKFEDCFTEHDVFTDLLRKTSETENISIKEVLCQVKCAWVASGRTTVLGADVDGLKREFNRSDDPGRVYGMINHVRAICAMKANKKPHELTPSDCDIDIIYNGRPLHNQQFKEALKRGYFNYPTERFIILDIHPETTIGQTKSLRRHFAEQDNESFILCESDPYHTGRVGLTLGNLSPQANNESYQFIMKTALPKDVADYENTYFFINNAAISKLYYIGYAGKLRFVRINNLSQFRHGLTQMNIIENDVAHRLSYEEVMTLITCNNPDHVPDVNPLSKLKLLIVSTGKNEKRCGIRLDAQGEHGAMKRYSFGPEASIAKYQSPKVFYTDADLLIPNSFFNIMRWGNRDDGVVPYQAPKADM